MQILFTPKLYTLLKAGRAKEQVFKNILSKVDDVFVVLPPAIACAPGLSIEKKLVS